MYNAKGLHFTTSFLDDFKLYFVYYSTILDFSSAALLQ
jgi:hypothetical protein